MSRAFTAPPGGVLTRGVGAITGELELVALAGGRARVRYAGAQDVYTVTGTVPDGWSEQQVVAHLAADPGPGADGNPAATRLP